MTSDREVPLPQDEPRQSFAAVHLLGAGREALAHALRQLGYAGAPVAVLPPRRLGPGFFLSPPRGAWLTLYCDGDGGQEWIPALCGAVRAPAVRIECIESELWSAEFFDAEGEYLGHIARPESAWESHVLEAAGEEAALEWRESRITAEELSDFLFSPHRAYSLARFLGETGVPGRTGPNTAEAELDRLCSILGIVEDRWDPAADEDALLEGDYDAGDEGFPADWPEFWWLPGRQLPILGEAPAGAGQGWR